MSVIIIREKGAKKIQTSVLKKLVNKTGEGWGITWYNKNGIAFQKNPDMKLFLNKFQSLEEQDFPMIVHLNEFYSGSKCGANLQPTYIDQNMGILTIDGWISKVPDKIDPVFSQTYKEKSDEYIIGELFKDFCKDKKNMSPIHIWNKFLIEKKEYLENCILILMLKNGSIINSTPESGYFQNGNKLWFSTLKGIKTIEDRKALTIKEVYAKFNQYDLIELSDLRNLTRKQILKIVKNNNYKYFIAELIKYKTVGIDSVDENSEILYSGMEEEYVPEEHDSNPDREECIDCQEVFNKNLLIDIIVHGNVKYICSECIKENGVDADKMVSNNDISFAYG